MMSTSHTSMTSTGSSAGYSGANMMLINGLSANQNQVSQDKRVFTYSLNRTVHMIYDILHMIFMHSFSVKYGKKLLHPKAKGCFRAETPNMPCRICLHLLSLFFKPSLVFL